MPEEGYRQQGGMTAFPDLGATTGLMSENLVRGVTPQSRPGKLLGYHVYNRRLLMLMLLPRFAGVLFFRGRDMTKFLE